MRITDLVATPAEAYDVALLREGLRIAAALELATLPPYLCGRWSVDGDDPGSVSVTISTVLFEEMLHVGLVGNLTTAIGGTPRFDPPAYPLEHPSGVVVPLQGLTPEYVRDVYLRLEYPDGAVGALYDTLARMFQVVDPPFGGGPQREAVIRAHVLTPITTLDEALTALTTVKEQGEGTATSPDAVHIGDPLGLPHHYRFGEVAHGRRVTLVDGRWAYAGEPVPFPETLPMARVPAGGWTGTPPAVTKQLHAFSTAYGTLLRGLTAAWSPAGTDDDLQVAIAAMFELGGPADALMRMPRADGPGNYGPDFVLRD